MKTHSPSHEEVTRRAQEIWEARGRPEGRDTDIWLEAERQLTNASPAAETSSGQPAAESTAKVVNQKKVARAPKVPTKTAPKSVPAETGKPLWNKPHSS